MLDIGRQLNGLPPERVASQSAKPHGRNSGRNPLDGVSVFLRSAHGTMADLYMNLSGRSIHLPTQSRAFRALPVTSLDASEAR